MSTPSHSSTSWSRFQVPVWKLGLLAALVVLTVTLCFVSRPADTIPKPGVVMDLPPYDMRNGWFGEESEISHAERTILPSDTEFARKTYTNARRESILCSIVLAASQDRSIHRPERCLPGQGYTLNGSTPIDVQMPNGDTLRAQCLDLSHTQYDVNGNPYTLHSLYIYWFVGDGLTTNSNLERVVRGVFDRVFLNRQHRWAYVIVSSPITASFSAQGRSRDETLAMLKEFMRTMVPKFQKEFMESGAEELDVEIEVSSTAG
ncbi:MAG: exosortase C-terminal domain/associated protein EpsI [Verrucomicrobiota bacterium]